MTCVVAVQLSEYSPSFTPNDRLLPSEQQVPQVAFPIYSRETEPAKQRQVAQM